MVLAGADSRSSVAPLGAQGTAVSPGWGQPHPQGLQEQLQPRETEGRQLQVESPQVLQGGVKRWGCPIPEVSKARLEQPGAVELDGL